MSCKFSVSIKHECTNNKIILSADIPLVCLDGSTWAASLSLLVQALEGGVNFVLCSSISVGLAKQSNKGLQNLETDSLLALLETVDESRGDGRVKLSKKILTSSNNGCEKLGGCATDLPRHVVVIRVFTIMASNP